MVTKAQRTTTIREALRLAVADARESGRMSPGLEVQALIADRLAGVVDATTEAAELVRVVAEFQRALSVLPLDAPAPVGGSGDDDPRGRVLHALDSPPQVGDSADAG